MTGLRRYARPTLAGVRLFYGTVALVAPQVLIRRASPAPTPDPAAIYAFRMFGIRTVLLGYDLLGPPDERALRRALIVHGSDVATAAWLGVSGRVPRRKAVLLTAVSSANLALAWAAQHDAE